VSAALVRWGSSPADTQGEGPACASASTGPAFPEGGPTPNLSWDQLVERELTTAELFELADGGTW
jgi:hypothetical protein